MTHKRVVTDELKPSNAQGLGGDYDPTGRFTGDGFVQQDCRRGPAVRPPHDMAFPDPQSVQDASLSLVGTKTWPNIKSPLKHRKTKLAVLGIPSHILEAGSKEYARTVRLAQSYKTARSREFFEAHGYVSSGVGALLASASLALSASRFLYELGASTPIVADERGQLTMPQVLQMASRLSDSARQNELSAWELCAREAVVRKRNENSNVAVPWLVEGAAGEVKRGPGRPRKVHVVEESVSSVAEPLSDLVSSEESNA